MNTQITNDTAVDSTWSSLYKAGGCAALVIATLFLVEMVAYITTSAPDLADTAGWFNLFQHNRYIGLIDFGILEMIALVLFVPMFLAICVSLRRASQSYMAVAAILAFVGIAVNFATGKLFTLLTLSDLYASAATEALRSQYLAIGRSALALGALGGIGGSVEGGIPMAVAGMIISIIMVRSKILGRAVGVVGILANGTGLAMYINAALVPTPSGSPYFGAFFVFHIIWFFLAGLKLLQYK